MPFSDGPNPLMGRVWEGAPSQGGTWIAVIWPLPTPSGRTPREIEFHRFRLFYWQLSRHAVSFLSLRCEWSPSAVV